MRPPQSWKDAPLTRAIGAVTAVAWLGAALFGLDGQAAFVGGFVPLRAAAGEPGAILLAPLTATLVHGGLVHLAFNLLILLYCGRAVETIVGSRQFGLLYVIGAYAAAMAHYAVDPASAVPMIGASGAISAVIGAYAMVFGRNRVKVDNPRLALWLNALWLAIAWVVLQLLIGFTFQVDGAARIAIAAHIGGFLAGLLLAKPLLLLRYRGA